MNKAPRVVEDLAPPGTLQSGEMERGPLNLHQSLQIRAHHEFLSVESPPPFSAERLREDQRTSKSPTNPRRFGHQPRQRIRFFGGNDRYY